MMIFALLAALQSTPAPAVAPAEVKAFGDWAVACDNRRACEMTSLFPEDGEWPDALLGVSIVRAGGPAGGFIVLVEGEKIRGLTSVAVDGRQLATGQANDQVLRIAGSDAAEIVAAATNGARIVIGGENGTVGAVSLKGSSAALRYMDAQQGRAGTVTAAVATGSNPAASVPAVPPPGVVPALRPTGSAAPVPPELRTAMEHAAGCDAMYGDGDTRPDSEAHPLGGGATLVLLPCGNGAYNFSSVPFVLRGSSFTQATLDYDDGSAMLTNAGWDDGVLTSYAKGRGIGDCGELARYVWDGERFRAIEIRRMSECRGSTNWLTVWQANPAWR